MRYSVLPRDVLGFPLDGGPATFVLLWTARRFARSVAADMRGATTEIWRTPLFGKDRLVESLPPGLA